MLSRREVNHALTNITAMVSNPFNIANQEKQICGSGNNACIFCHHFYQLNPDCVNYPSFK